MPEVHLRAKEAERRVLSYERPLELQRDVPAEQEEGPMSHVDDSHEAEDEGEPARHDEVDTGRREAVEQGGEEVLRVVDGRAEVRLGARAARVATWLGKDEDPKEGEHDCCAGEDPRRVPRNAREHELLAHLRRYRFGGAHLALRVEGPRFVPLG